MKLNRKAKSRNMFLCPHTKVKDWGSQKIIEKIDKAMEILYRSK